MHYMGDAEFNEYSELIAIINKDNDADLCAVVEKRLLHHNRLGSNLYLLNQEFMILLQEQKIPKHSFDIDQLSILEHWSLQKADRKKITLDITVKLAKRCDHLQQIVLRGCSTAGAKNIKKITPKTVRVLSRKKDIKEASLNEHEFLFQQKISSSTKEIKTYLKFYNIEGKLTIKKCNNIPLNTENNKLSKEIETTLALISKENNFPPLSFQKIRDELDKTRKSIRTNFPISQKDKKILAASLSGIKTYTVNKFPSYSLADHLDQKLKQEGIDVTIKAYVGAYEAHPKSGTISVETHGQKNTPKAFRKYPEVHFFNEQFEDKTDSVGDLEDNNQIPPP